MSDLSQALVDKCRHLLVDDLRAIEGCLARLHEADVWWRPNSVSNSVGNLLMHLNGSLTEWIVGGVDLQPFVRDRAAEFLTMPRSTTSSELWRTLQTTVEEALRVLERLDEASLLSRREIRQQNVSVLDAILHSVHHFGEHSGQIVLITKARTAIDLELTSLRTIATPCRP
jgi:uncharacterized damage-inducible protein DinB